MTKRRTDEDVIDPRWLSDPPSAPAKLRRNVAATMAGVSTRTMIRWERAGFVRSTKPAGGRVLVDRDSLIAFLDRGLRR